MSNIFITDIIGTGTYAVPANDTALASATSGLETLLSGVANLSYDRVLAWVEDAGGPGGAEGNRTLNCLVEKFLYSAEECPDETEVDTLTSAIETALEADANITSVDQQQVHIFQAGAYHLWQRDATGGFLYPTTTTDDVCVGGHVAPTGRWFDNGAIALGGNTMSGLEMLRVIGDARVEGVLNQTTTGISYFESRLVVGGTAPLYGEQLLSFSDDNGRLFGIVSELDVTSYSLYPNNKTAISAYIYHSDANDKSATYTGVDSEVQWDPNNTLDDVRLFAGRLSVQYGTVTNYTGLLIEAVSGNGAPANSYGVYIGTMSGTTTSYGIYQDTQADTNVFYGPVVSGADSASSASVGIEVASTARAFLPSRLTTVQRDALTEVVGMVVWNTTDATLQVCTATGSPGTWTNIPGAGAGYWSRDVGSGFVYLSTSTDDICIGGSVSPKGKWFENGDLALGSAAMYGSNERLYVLNSYVVGDANRTGIYVIGALPAGTNTYDGWVGIYSSTGDAGTNELTDSVGFQHEIVCTGTSTMVRAYGIYLTAISHNTATFTNRYGLYVASPSGTGSPVNAYGVYLEAQEGATLSYGVYQAGSTDINCFNGFVAVGTTAMNSVERLLVWNVQKDTDFYGVNNQLKTASGSGAEDNIIGYICSFSDDGSNTVTDLIDYYAQTYVGTTTQMTNNYGFWEQTYVQTGGVLTNHYGMRIVSPSVSGTLTNSYGVYLDAQNGGTLSYGIYQNGTSDLNVFRGDVVIGGTAMSSTELLRVVGNARVEGSIYTNDGAAATPAYSFLNDTNTGFYRSGADEISVTTGGQQSCYISNNGIYAGFDFFGIFTGIGEQGAPTHSFVSDHDTGMFLNALNEIGFSCGDFSIMVLTATDVTIDGKLTVTGLIDPTGLVLNDQASNPWTPASGYGCVWVKNDSPTTLRFTDSGGNTTQIGGSAFLAANGTVSAPSYSFFGDTNNGIYWVSADKVGFSANGVLNAYYQATDRAFVCEGIFGVGPDAYSSAAAIYAHNGQDSGSSTYYGIRAGSFKEDAGSITGTFIDISAHAVVDSGSVSNYRRLNAESPTGSGSISTSIYGLYIDTQKTGPAASVTNSYGIYQAGSSDTNYFAGPVTVGSAGIETSAGIELDSTTKALLVSRMTTTERNALTAVNGMIIYDTTENKFKGRQNGSWVDLA